MIAAAGCSSRMGFDKALLAIDNQPAVIFSARVLSAIDPALLFATLPQHLLKDDALTASLARYGCQSIANVYASAGYSGSIMSVLQLLPANIDGLLITPVDSPIACASLVKAMIKTAALRKDAATIIVPYHRDHPGHPVYFSKHFFKRLGECHHSGGPRSVITNHQNAVLKFFWPDDRILLNLNRRYDVKRCENFFAAR